MTTPSRSDDALTHLTEAVDALAWALMDAGYLTARRSKRIFGEIDKARELLKMPLREEDPLV